jgi:hypothetical protein
MQGNAMTKPAKPKDLGHIGFAELEDLDWAAGQAEASLDKAARFVRDHGRQAVEWYLDKKASKRLGAHVTRSAAILLVVLAGLVPLLGEIGTPDGRPWVNPLWTSVLLVLAGGCIGLDRFFGYSTAYIRYLTTEQRLLLLIHKFQMDWQIRRAGWAGQEPGVAQLQDALAACKQFLLSLDQAVQAETDAWAQEFMAAIVEIDRTATAQGEAARGGAINVTVTNGDQCPDGWLLSIDGGAGQKSSGRSAALRGIAPGPHNIKVIGTIDSMPKQSERNALVTAGSVVDIELSLE